MTTQAAKKQPTWTPVPASLIAAVLALLLSLTALEPMSIQGRSMEPGFERGRTVIVHRSAYGLRLPLSTQYLVQWRGPQRDDIIVLAEHNGKQRLMKRVVAVEHDTVHLQGLNVFFADISFTVTPQVAADLAVHHTVPSGHAFVIGDNELYSRDSRHFGLVSHEQILGRVLNARREPASEGGVEHKPRTRNEQ